jgi:hypothetical protein
MRDLLGHVEKLADENEVIVQIAGHAHGLRTLSGKKKNHFAGHDTSALALG